MNWSANCLNPAVYFTRKDHLVFPSFEMQPSTCIEAVGLCLATKPA
jgi:hypothetical protein